MGYIDELGKNAKVASRSLVKLGTAEKNQILGQVEDALLAETDYILAENARDVDQAQKNGISPVMVDRLRLDAKRIEGIVEASVKLRICKTRLVRLSVVIPILMA